MIVTNISLDGKLKSKILNFNDKDEFISFLNKETTEKLCEYLKRENKTVNIKDTFDSQADWYGFEFWLDKIDFSGNGFCFNQKNSIERLESYLLTKELIFKIKNKK